jgi:DNA-binding NarL/FixJ family response regulator
VTVLREKSLKPENRITVLLVDDHKFLRTELRKLLEAENDMHVVGEAADGKQAVDMALKLRPAVVVMDIAMPKLNGLEATRQILQGLPATRVLICSAHSEDAYVERAREVGAAGHLSKLTFVGILVTAIRAVQKGDAFFDPALAKGLNK